MGCDIRGGSARSPSNNRFSALLFDEEEEEDDDDDEEATIRGFLVRVLEAAPPLSAPWIPCGGSGE